MTSLRWGRIDADGTVWVRTEAGERQIGSWQAGDLAAGLAHYERRYDDLATEVELLEQRLASGAGDSASTLAQGATLRESLSTVAAIGDLGALDRRLAKLSEAAQAKAQEVAAERAHARAEAVAAKELLVAAAERLAESSQWSLAGDRFKDLEWRWQQIRGVDRRTDAALLKRFVTARDAFGRRLDLHLAGLDQQHRPVSAAVESKAGLGARDLRVYDVALSYAAEERTYVEAVAGGCVEVGITVFYDLYERATLWGKDLYRHLDWVYSGAAHYCVMFISAAYARKAWTTHEQRSAQERAFKQHGEYILPVLFDETRLPGMPATIGYIDARSTEPAELVRLIRQKL